MKYSSSQIVQTILFLTVAGLYLLTLMPVEVRWADADLWLLKLVPVICVIGVGRLRVVRKSIDITKEDLAIAAWFTYYIVRVYVGNEYPCAIEFLKISSTVLLYVSLRLLFANSRLSAWWLIVPIMICGCYEAIYGLLQTITGISRNHLFLITGSFHNPGPYSAYIMIGAVVGVCTIQEYLESKRNVSFKRTLLVLTTIMLAVLPATWSRAAFVGLGVCILWIFRERYWRYRYFVWSALCVLVVILYFIKQGSVEGRVVIWMASLMSWSQAPWVGVGVGGFRHACAEGIAELWKSYPDSRMFDSAGVADYAYNSLLKILVEQGVVGATLCVTIVFLTMQRLYTHSKSLFMGMLSLLIFSMFSYPFELLPYRVMGVVIIAWSQTNKSTNTGEQTNLQRTFGVAAACAIALLGVCVCRESIRRSTADKDCRLFAGVYNEAFIDDYYELLPDEMDNPQFLFDFAKTLRECRRYRDSNAVLRMGTMVSADPMFYVLQGNNYRDEGFYDSAEKAYKKAFAVMPNRIYPLYQLMKLYQEKDDIVKSVEYATRITQFKEKISSPATEQMKKEASDLLQYNPIKRTK